MRELLVRGRWALGACVALIAGPGAALAISASGSAAAGTPSSIKGGQTIASGGHLETPDGHYLLTMQTGGNLVEWIQGSANFGGRLLAQSGTNGHPGAYATLQDNGALIVKAPNGDVLWNSNATTSGCPSLDLQSDGNLAIYGTSTKAIWSNGVAPHGFASGDKLGSGQTLYSPAYGYKLYMAGNGDLKLYNDSNQQIWDSNTTNNAGGYAKLLSTGNLVVYNSAGNKILWQTNTANNAGATAQLQNDGNLAVYSKANKLLWQAKSTGHAGTGAAFNARGPLGSKTPCPTPVPTPPAPVTNTVTQTQTVTTTQTSTIVAGPPPKRGHLHVKFGLNWLYKFANTRLVNLHNTTAFPRGSVFTGEYIHHKRHVVHANTPREVKHLLHWADEIVYHPNDLFEITVTKRGYVHEALSFRILYGKSPRCRPACKVAHKR